MEPTDWRSAVRTVSEDTVHLDLFVNPGSSSVEVGPYDPWRQRIHVEVTAPATAGKANRELLATLADLAGVPAARVCIIRGATTRRKTVSVEGVETEGLLEALSAALGAGARGPR